MPDLPLKSAALLSKLRKTFGANPFTKGPAKRSGMGWEFTVQGEGVYDVVGESSLRGLPLSCWKALVSRELVVQDEDGRWRVEENE